MRYCTVNMAKMLRNERVQLRRTSSSGEVDELSGCELAFDSKIGEGSSAEIWSVSIFNTAQDGVPPLLLCARVFKAHVRQQQINEEVKKLKMIDELQIHHCAPRFYGLYEFSHQRRSSHVILQSRLGSDLSTSMNDFVTGSTQWESFVQTISRVYAMMMTSLNCFHSKGWLHLDIKPSNFCVPYGETIEQCKRIYLIDFEKGINIDDEY